MTSPQVYTNFTLDPSGRNTQPTIKTVSILQGIGQQDMAAVTVRGLSPDLPELSTGTPVDLVYGWNPFQLEHFYGYVSHYRPETDFTKVNDTIFYDIFCLGASFVFKDAYSGFWNDTQVSKLLTNVANQQMFSLQVEETDLVWPSVASAGVSGWEFFREQASKQGWILACNKTNIRFMSTDTAMKRNAANMPVFFTASAAPSQNYQGISKFQVQQGETVNLDGSTRAVRYLSGVDALTGKTYTVSNDASQTDFTAIAARVAPPFLSRQETRIVAPTTSFAQQVLDAETQKNRFHIKATATVSGDTSVVQGTPVLLLGLGVNSSGVWFVEHVEHCLQKGKYTLELQLGRDATGDTGFRPSLPSYVAWSTTIGQAPSSVPSSQLVQGRWRAENASTEVVGS